MSEFAKRLDGVSGSAIRELFKLAGDPEIISFGGGNPSKDSFPVDVIRDITDKKLKDEGKILLQYGGTEGYMPLRKAYLEHLAGPKGVKGEIDNVLITTGSMQGLDLTLKALVDPGDVVLVESPTFLGALQAFNIAQAKLVGVPMDDEGVIIEELEALIKQHHPKLFYCIPTFQNPTGKTLSEPRRRKIAALAAQYDVTVIEDDPYCDLRYSGEPMPCIKQFDEADKVILMNSFSKIISPGIRVGVALGRKELIRKMTICKQCTDTHTPLLTQAIAAEFLERGLLPGHLKKILPAYAVQLNTMLDCADEFFPATAKITRPQGGLFVWCELAEGVSGEAVFKKAVSEYKVAFVPGEHFYCDGTGKNTIRLNFSSETPEKIKIGMERLGKAIKAF